jgi:hypothetical protein
MYHCFNFLFPKYPPSELPKSFIENAERLSPNSGRLTSISFPDSASITYLTLSPIYMVSLSTPVLTVTGLLTVVSSASAKEQKRTIENSSVKTVLFIVISSFLSS